MKQQRCKQEQKCVFFYFLFCYLSWLFLRHKVSWTSGSKCILYFSLYHASKQEKKKTLCMFISLLVLASRWSSSPLGGRGGGVSGRKLLHMSASSKLPSPCSPVTTVIGQKKNELQFFPLVARGVVQLWCNFIMGCLYETNSSSHHQGKFQEEAGHGEGTTHTTTERPVVPHIVKNI